MMTSSRRVRSSSLRSRGVVVAACQTAARSGPSVRRRSRGLGDPPRPLPFAALEIGLGGFERPQALFPIAVRKWLKAGLLEEEVVTDSDKGTGQGSVAKLRGGSTRIRRLTPISSTVAQAR